MRVALIEPGKIDSRCSPRAAAASTGSPSTYRPSTGLRTGAAYVRHESAGLPAQRSSSHTPVTGTPDSLFVAALRHITPDELTRRPPTNRCFLTQWYPRPSDA
jgi:hypothetical protein